MWIVAEDPLAAAGLAAAFGRERDLEIARQLRPADIEAGASGTGIAEPGPGSIALLDASGAGADVVVWDLGLRGLTNHEPEAFQAGAPILALVAEHEEVAAALARGAAGALQRDAPAVRVAAAVRAVAAGLAVLDPEGAAAAFRRRAPDPELVVEPLTPRELEVLQHLAVGLANKEIARALSISEHTVKFHVNSILAKLGAETRTEAVVRAARLGLVVL